MKHLLQIVLLISVTGCNKPEPVEVEAFNILALPLDDSGSLQYETDRYSINLRIPRSGNPRVEADVRQFLQTQVDDLLQSTSEEPEPGYFLSHQYELVSDWDNAQSATLYTFIVRGHLYTGGAHGMPFLQTFSYAQEDHRRVELPELLASDDSLATISELAGRHFADSLPSEMLGAGLSPERANWQNWFVSNNRISFLFPPYQIAAYAEGEQLFGVLVEPETRHLFNLDYFEIYETDIQIADDAGHGPDPGSEEAAHSAAWQLISRSPAYVEDGHSLKITAIEPLAGVESAWIADYIWQHYGDPNGDYSGQVRIVNDRPEFVESGVP